jgi:hypothetical protein
MIIPVHRHSPEGTPAVHPRALEAMISVERMLF